ncbi:MULTISPECIES: recombinase family protein [Paraburkholderia]|uniref:Recombinase family protein n=1 Tax=Paraburkholderia nemoris TaxID=2793076 RepID=A0ABM8T1U2_9BURK|nr:MULTISPECIES: recombinase family protein [Paraburkholderia]KPD14817.1 recombinase [Burkholderia sp. ST111]MBK5151798.1 recombinase family protein [Burkholderia sp. R-69608]MBK5184362.1 recombinase family protein [Burkholderia sp. R-69749]MBK3744683.1 recombinase family protein [Paraburkholderia aspalathi]MBK3815793.1 recombinase family protein [Paraburkholderia aspalathi]
MPSARSRRASPSAPLSAVQYIRMSTDHQEYSPVFQRQAIAAYAVAHHIRIVDEYEDAGISGLTLRERPALVQLLLDVDNPKRKFTTVLVYDVSRWGRFQDVDEAAFYEYACRRTGVNVVYVAEPFENDGSPATSVLKALKRAMAAEFSREMSRKVFLGHCLNVERGFHTGGPPGYGLHRVLLDADRHVRHSLDRYEYKSVQTDRVIIAPATGGEAGVVRKIYEWYATQPITAAAIARRLNDFGICNGAGRPWQAQNILNILRNEAYIGTNVYSRTTSKLANTWERVPEQDWIRVPGAFEPVVDKRIFTAVQQKMERARRKPTRDEIIDGLHKVIKRAGTLSQATLRHYRSAPSVEQVMHEFGSLNAAYKAIGYAPNLDPARSQNRSIERCMEKRVADITVEVLRSRDHEVRYEKHTDTICIDGTLRLKLVVRSPWLIGGHVPYWVARWPDRFPIDFLIYGRIERADTDLLDFHMFPRGSLVPGAYTVVHRYDQSHFKAYQHPDLLRLLDIAESIPLEVLSSNAPNESSR